MKTENQGGARISFLYHSGAGGTRLVAELLGEILSSDQRTRVVSIHDSEAAAAVSEADLLVFCFPTYYLRPSPSMAEFIAALPPVDPPRVAYLVATYELYTENCLRACALSLKSRGIRVAGSRAIRSPGSDITCVAPSRLCRWLYRFEGGFSGKLLSIADEISSLARTDHPRERIPFIKWYTPLAQLLQVLFLDRFDGWRGKVRVLPERCTRCEACIADCDRGAWVREGEELRHLPERCELCTRCIHRCPRKAIVLVERLKDNPRLDRRLYGRLKAEARERLREAGVDLERANRRHHEREIVRVPAGE